MRGGPERGHEGEDRESDQAGGELAGEAGGSGPGGDSQGDQLVAAFARWAAAQRVSEAASGRSRERFLTEQAAGGASLAGLLVDMAEDASTVTLAVAGLRLSGRLVGVGSDFCVLDQLGGRPVLVSTPAILGVWPAGPVRAGLAGDRLPALGLSLMAALASLAEDRVPVRLRLGSLAVDGDLVRVGDEVVTLRAPAPSRRPVHVPMARVEVCEIR